MPGLYIRTHAPVIVTLRCRAFSGESPRLYCLRVDTDGTVRPFDCVAMHYTRRHALTARAVAKAQAEARRLRTAACDESPALYFDTKPARPGDG